MENILSYTLDTGRECFTIGKCKELDERPMQLTICDHGAMYDLTGAILKLNILKNDGTFIIQTDNINVSENVVTINPLNIDATRVPGNTQLELSITKNGLTVSTFTFNLIVMPSVMDGATESGNIITILEELNTAITSGQATLTQVNQAITDLNNLIASGGAVKVVDYNVDKVAMNAEIESIKTDVETTREKMFSPANVKYKGMALTIYSGLDYNAILDDMKNNIGVTHIELVVLHNVTSTTDANVVQTIPADVNTVISLCNTKGLKIAMLKPHITTEAAGDGFDRATYNPTDKAAFFTNWQTLMLSYADICNTNNIDMLSISCEMTILTDVTYFTNWQTLVNAVKAQYPNLKLIAASKSSEIIRNYVNRKKGLNHIEMLTDYIALNYYKGFNRNFALESLYIPLLCKFTGGKYTYSTLNGDSNKYNELMCAVEIGNALAKKVIVTETGCTYYNSTGDNIVTNNITGTNTAVDQLTYFQHIIPQLYNTSNVEGIFIWHYSSPFTLGTASKGYIKNIYGGTLNV